MLTKYLIPIIAIISFSGGAFFDSKILSKKCPDCKPEFHCPEQKPCQGIDFDKIKAKGLTIQNTQYLTVKGDSVTADMVRKALREELEDFKVRKCK